MAAAVGLCTYVGYFLDKKFLTDPWLTLAGCLLGMFTALKLVWDKIGKKDK